MAMRIIALCLGLVLSLGSWSLRAEEALCAEVKIEILQELTMERQGFEALMRITNSLDTFSLENVSVKVFFKDANGDPVVATSNTSASNAAFFIRKDDVQNVSGLQEGADGYLHSGSIAPKKVGELRWLIIPTANAAGQTKDGKLFFVGAELRYSYGGKEEVVTVADDTIVVKPQPALTLDYFLTEEVVGDNGFTPEIEPSEPYTLGVRINNNGFGTAKSVKIESAQPRIVENKLGLAVNFKILGSYLKDQPSVPSLLINFGNIEPKGVTNGRWIMESNLAGKFVDFKASYTHADELGGELTSLLQGTSRNFLARDVVMDLPGRDTQRDFLAYVADTRVLYVFESEPTGSNEIGCSNCKKVTEVATATLVPVDNSRSKVEFEPVGGLTYAVAADPFNGNKVLAKVVRENGTVVHPQNAWLSKKRASDNINFDYFINIFDNNSTGKYTVYWGGNLVDVPQSPVIQYVQDQVTFEGGNIGFIVKATDPNNTLPDLSAAQLPAGASFTKGALNEGVFEWSPVPGQAGLYTITFTATDGELTAERIVNVLVNPSHDTDGDGMDDAWEMEKFGNLDKDGTEDSDGDGRTDLQEFEEGTDPNLVDAAPAAPEILAPVYNADTLNGASLPLEPELVVTNGTHAPEVGPVAILFEVYKDEALTELMGAITLDEGAGAAAPTDGTTHWKISPVDLEETMVFEDNNLYYWRAKSVQTGTATASSAWVKSQFFINTANDPPTQPQISAPAIDASIADVSPTLIITNSTDVDRDELRYAFELFAENDLANPVATVDGLLPGNNGQTSWFVATLLKEDERYVWQASVTDEHNVVVKSEWGSFIVNTQNHAPTDPRIDSPLAASTIELQENNSVTLRVVNSTDPERKPIRYYFELDTVNTFDSDNKKASPLINAGTLHTEWKVTGLADDTRYFWRVKASDGEVDSAWVLSDFTASLANQPPSVPVLQNPVGGTVVATQFVLLEANPATDPEGSIVKYHIQLFGDAALTQPLVNEVSLAPMWQLDPILVDKATYYWRMRAEDAEGNLSEWSSVESFTVNLPATNAAPQFNFILPNVNVVLDGNPVLIQWEDVDPDSNARIKLFLKLPDSTESVVIAENLAEDPDSEFDTYWFDAENIPAGTYQLAAEIEDGDHTQTIIACCSITIPGGPSTPVPHSYWSFNEGSGDLTYSDLGGFAGELSVAAVSTNPAKAKPSWVTGRANSPALDFDGIGGYLALSKTATSPLLGDSTLSLWMKTSTTVSSGHPDKAPAIIASNVDKGELSNDIKWGSFGLKGQIGLAVGDARVIGLTKVNDDIWHHVVITRSVESGSRVGKVSIYVDGKLDGSGEPRDDQFNGLLNTFAGMAIRNTVYIYPTGTGYIGSGTGFLKSTLDDVRIYSRALSEQEVMALYHSDSGSLPVGESAYSQFIANNIYQGETASTRNTNITNNRPGYSGTGFADLAGENAYVEWVVNRPLRGPVNVVFRYANGAVGDFPLILSVNDLVTDTNLTFSKTANWSTWAELAKTVELQPGKNVIRLQVIPGNADGPNIDFMKLAP